MSKAKLPEWFSVSYPNWKKNLWGAGRAFVAGFTASLTTFLITVDTEKLTDIDWWLKFVLVGSITGGIIFLGKWLRDTFVESSDMQKIPI
jgi:H+/Cl- antiporter ClcA